VKKSKMDKQAVKELMFGGINELMRNSRYYYHSSTGQHYCRWTDDGKKALLEYMDLMGWKLREAEELDLKEKSKQLVLKGLKGETI